MIRPTAYLHFSLDENTFNAERAASLNRAFAYIAPTTVTAGNENAIDMMVKLPGHSLWNDEVHDDGFLWDDIIEPWLTAKMAKLFATVKGYNNPEARSYCGAIHYERLNLFMESRVVSVNIGDEDYGHVIDLVRQARKEYSPHQ